MSTTGTIPSLTEEGWINSSKTALVYLISYYILSDAMQTIVFNGNVISLPETYYKYINDPTNMAIAVKSDLEKLLGRYFVAVDVTAQAKELKDKKYAILIYASVIDKDNIKHELTRITEINSTGLRKIIELNNYGDGVNYINSIP